MKLIGKHPIIYPRVMWLLNVKGWSMGELARKCGIQYAVLRRRLIGEKGCITLNECKAIKGALDSDMTIEELFQTEAEP